MFGTELLSQTAARRLVSSIGTIITIERFERLRLEFHLDDGQADLLFPTIIIHTIRAPLLWRRHLSPTRKTQEPERRGTDAIKVAP